jgi:hypothetical protein
MSVDFIQAAREKRAERHARRVVENYAQATERDWSANDCKLYRLLVRELTSIIIEESRG